MGAIRRKDFQKELDEMLQRHGVREFLLVYSKEELTVGDMGAEIEKKKERRKNCLVSKHCDITWINSAIRFVLDIVTEKITGRAPMEMRQGMLVPGQSRLVQ